MKAVIPAGALIQHNGELYEVAEQGGVFVFVHPAATEPVPGGHCAVPGCDVCDDADDFGGILADKEMVSEVLGEAEKEKALDPATIGAILSLLPVVIDLIKKFRERRNKK